MLKLTARQQQILELIDQSIRSTGFPPTRAEIARELGFRSPNAAEDHLKALAKKGAITIVSGTSRGVRLTDKYKHLLKSAESEPASERSIEIPLVGRVAAGSPILAEEHIESRINLDPSFFSTIPDYFLRVKGDSMIDAGILDGDLLGVRKADTAEPGQIIVARIGSEVTVKRFSKRKQHIELLPANADYSPILVGPQEDFAVEGLAISLLRDGF